ncbi:hypothetical protein NHX12_014641 [Muraenolepis orangiensis]|uniref:Xanthine dehydrogenase n=1 Tax=Muraenolepis orangiensis TaxID=630683 RepID=A0A9Q0D8Y3_9TELE|nr:hypothetical protein NHX12_014641 [Muraenolepis orangiensis]
MGGQEHFYMETQGVIVVPRGEGGKMDVFAATQHAAFTQITVHVKRLGGAFGGKVMKIVSLSAITAVSAQKTGKAVRCSLLRGEDMLITGGRHPFLGKYKVGYNSDGSVVVADVVYYSNGGSTLDESGFIMEKALLHMDNGYNIPNLRGRGVVCQTNLPSYTAFRGFGGPQGLTVMESILHEVAVCCGLTPKEVREVNMYREETCYTHTRQPFKPRDMLRCWDTCLDRAAYHQRLRNIQLFNFKFKFEWDSPRIASHVLRVPMASIFIKETNTGSVPNAVPSTASFGTHAVGMAVKVSEGQTPDLWCVDV